MNIMDYEKQKIKNWSTEQLTWKLFELTGQVNYFMLFHAITEMEKEQKWTNTESKEL